jgi:hypothetical protein
VSSACYLGLECVDTNRVPKPLEHIATLYKEHCGTSIALECEEQLHGPDSQHTFPCYVFFA